MKHYLKTCDIPDEDGRVDVLVNNTKKNYIKLNGINPQNVIDGIHHFMCHYKIWDDADRVTLTRKNHIPDSRSHNITFVMTFYNMAQKSQELKEKILQEEKNNEIPEFNEDHNIKSKQISVQRLTNPNISHTINVENNISAEKKIQY